MKKLVALSILSVMIFASCKKTKDDIKPQQDNAQAQTHTTPAAVVPLTAKFTYTVQDPINIFENQSIKFNNLSTGAAKWVWEFGNTTKSTELEPTMSYPWHGYYTVTLSTWDTNGNKQTYSQDISILCLFANGIHPPQGAGG